MISSLQLEKLFLSEELYQEKAESFAIPTCRLTDDISALDCDGQIVFFTSGSSGEPKAVVHKLENLNLAAAASNAFTGLSSEDKWLISLPLSHVGGFSIVLRTALVGAKVLVSKNSELRESLAQFKPTHISLVPTQLEQIIEEDLSFLKLILLGGASVPEELLERAGDKDLKVLASYGMTEAGSTVAIITRDGFLKPLEAVQLRVDSTSGELLIKSPQLFIGYQSGDLIDTSVLKDAWFRTGDLASIDSKGRIKLLGRSDRTMISGGENIHPREIEAQVENLEGIRTVAVIAKEDKTWGQRPVLFYEASKEVSSQFIKEQLEKKLPRFKIPEEILRLDSIPRTSLGKVDFQSLKSRLFK